VDGRALQAQGYTVPAVASGTASSTAVAELPPLPAKVRLVPVTSSAGGIYPGDFFCRRAMRAVAHRGEMYRVRLMPLAMSRRRIDFC
jgi:hypothetical protein